MKKKLKKLQIHRETVKKLSGARIGVEIGRGFPTWPTCPDSGCYVCSGATCTMACGSCGPAF